MTAAEVYASLTAKGWVQHADGSWSKGPCKSDPVAPLGCAEPEPHPLPALVKKSPARSGRPPRLALVVTFISCRRKLCDSDNLVAAHKACRDAIAQSLGLDDADPRIQWEYHQIVTRGETGTIVKIDAISIH